MMAVFLAVLMLGLPSFNFGGQHVNVSPADNAAATAGNRVLTVGWPEFTTSIATLNPLLYTMASEMMTIWPCYSYMFTRDVNGNMIGDLVTSYKVSPDGKTWDFDLVTSARFYDKNDPGTVHALTGADVKYTFELVQNQSGNYLQSYFPVVNGHPIIQSITVPVGNVYHVTVTLSAVYAPFLSALTSIPILPQYVWSTQSWNWDNFRTRTPIIAPIIGSGPFYYSLNGLPSTGSVELVKSPTWFAIEEYGWSMHVNRLVVKTELSSDTNLIDYQSGTIDIMELVSPSQYLNSSLPGVKFAQSTGFVYEYNLNQMTDALRATYPALRQGTNNQLLLDPTVKLAMAMMVDKPGFVSGVLNGLGSVADSLVPDIHPAHYTYPTPVQYNPAQARQDLWNAGWKYDLTGNLLTPTSTVYPVCKVGGTDPLRFRFWTMDSSPEWDIGGRLMATWAALGGVDLWYDYKPQNTAFMNNAWANANYDTWLWDWMFSPTSEVSTDIMQVLTTEAIGSWSDIFWSNKTYDDTYYASLQEVDPAARRILTDSLQAQAYENLGCELVAYRKELYAASNLGADHWELASYGDWAAHYTLMPDQLYPWLYMQVEPTDNHAPTITGFQTAYSGDTSTAIPMTGSALDDHYGVEYRWFFGDGNKTGWQTSPDTTHRYYKDGIYGAYLAVRELAPSADLFVTWRKATVTVIDIGNTAPHNVDFTYSPTDPDSGTQVYLNATAIDDNGDTMTFTWVFGDGSSGKGQYVVHQFAKGDPSYTVKLSVDDGHLGQAPRPVNASHLISVTPNTAPTCSVADQAAFQNTMTAFTVGTADPDARDTHRYTWNWGDGTAWNVSTTPTAYHSYKFIRVETLTVWADDMTGLSGHNVSDTGLINVIKIGTNHAPVITQFIRDVTSPVTGQIVTFTGTATDPDGDICRMKFDFGDGTNTTVAQTSANTTLTATHVYTATGFKVAYLIVDDGPQTGYLTVQSSPMTFTVNKATFSLVLVAGWNFVSVPLTSTGYKASTLGLSTGDVVARWSPSAQVYDKTFNVGISPPLFDFTIDDSTGYWIYAASPKTLSLQGDLASTTMFKSITVPSTGGWATIGFCSMNATRHAEDVAGMYNIVGGILTIAKYTAGVYVTHNMGLPINNFLLAAGAGYWIWVNASGVVAYDP